MEFTKEDLNLENGLEKEWLITNGIGGYSSSTIIGANTRKYHGLLVAPLTPPARRFLILSKLDESIEINEKKYDLYTNICKEYISRGYEYQEEFRKEQLIRDKSEFDKEIELIRNIIKTREELKNDNKNFEFAEMELVDYYIYHIKANQAKLNYLLKLAKANGITIDRINQLKYENYDEEIG